MAKLKIFAAVRRLEKPWAGAAPRDWRAPVSWQGPFPARRGSQLLGLRSHLSLPFVGLPVHLAGGLRPQRMGQGGCELKMTDDADELNLREPSRNCRWLSFVSLIAWVNLMGSRFGYGACKRARVSAAQAGSRLFAARRIYKGMPQRQMLRDARMAAGLRAGC